MRPLLMTVGAVGLVLGAALLAIGPLYVTTGFYKQEARLMESGPAGSNSTQLIQAFNDVANQALEIALAGAVIAAAGGGLLAFGVATSKTEAEDQIEPDEMPTQP